MMRALFRLTRKRRDARLERVRAQEMADELAHEIHLKEVELSQLHEVVDIAKREDKESRIDLRRALRERRRCLAGLLDGLAGSFEASVEQLGDDLNGGAER